LATGTTSSSSAPPPSDFPHNREVAATTKSAVTFASTAAPAPRIQQLPGAPQLLLRSQRARSPNISAVEPIPEEPPERGKRREAIAESQPVAAGQARTAVERHSLSAAPRRAGKKKGHQWQPVADAFELARVNEMARRTQSMGPASTTSSRQGAAEAKAAMSASVASDSTDVEARLRLQSIAEEKMQAVEAEDFVRAAALKQEERKIQQMLQERSWATIASTRSGKQDQTSQNAWGPSARARSAGPPSQRSMTPHSSVPSRPLLPGPAATPPQRGNASASDGHGGLVFFLTAPGELNAESFKPMTAHVGRRDAIARIASAALWRGRGKVWESAREVVFLFEDQQLLRVQPRFVASCPVPSEYHIITVLGRALERDGAPGIDVVSCDKSRPLGGHVDRIIAEYSRKGPTAGVLLHEGHPQNLGLYGTTEDKQGEIGAEDRTLIFFLGAVKDMTAEEMRVVHRACKASNVPCVEANLGQQAEFTSKIVDVLHGHHVHRRLMPAVWKIARRVGDPDRSTPVQAQKSPKGTFWIFAPVSGGPHDLATDDRKKDGLYEVPRSCISQLWCSKNEHRTHVLSFVFAGGEVLTVYPQLVTCLKMQHRAAPTEKNVVNALRVGLGHQKVDPSLVIEPGCVELSDISDLPSERIRKLVDRQKACLLDMQLGGDQAPRLVAYADGQRAACAAAHGAAIRDVVVLLHPEGGRDFPKGFREKLASKLLDNKGSSVMEETGSRVIATGCKGPGAQWHRACFPSMSINAAISMLAHYWCTHTLVPTLAARIHAASSMVSSTATETAVSAAEAVTSVTQDNTSIDETTLGHDGSDDVAQRVQNLHSRSTPSMRSALERSSTAPNHQASWSSRVATVHPWHRKREGSREGVRGKEDQKSDDKMPPQATTARHAAGPRVAEGEVIDNASASCDDRGKRFARNGWGPPGAGFRAAVAAATAPVKQPLPGTDNFHSTSVPSGMNSTTFTPEEHPGRGSTRTAWRSESGTQAIMRGNPVDARQEKPLGASVQGRGRHTDRDEIRSSGTAGGPQSSAVASNRDEDHAREKGSPSRRRSGPPITVIIDPRSVLDERDGVEPRSRGGPQKVGGYGVGSTRANWRDRWDGWSRDAGGHRRGGGDVRGGASARDKHSLHRARSGEADSAGHTWRGHHADQKGLVTDRKRPVPAPSRSVGDDRVEHSPLKQRGVTGRSKSRGKEQQEDTSGSNSLQTGKSASKDQSGAVSWQKVRGPVHEGMPGTAQDTAWDLF